MEKTQALPPREIKRATAIRAAGHIHRDYFHSKPLKNLCFVIGGGGSLTDGQINLARLLKKTGHASIVGVNNAFQICQDLDLLHACDASWWETYPEAKSLTIPMSCLDTRINADNVFMFENSGAYGYENHPLKLRHGKNSGYQAVQLAARLGAKSILLLGFDMHCDSGRSHWFGEHPGRSCRPEIYESMLKAWPSLKEPLTQMGVNVYNITPGSKLDEFEKWSIF